MHPLLTQLTAGLTCVTRIFGIWHLCAPQAGARPRAASSAKGPAAAAVAPPAEAADTIGGALMDAGAGDALVPATEALAEGDAGQWGGGGYGGADGGWSGAGGQWMPDGTWLADPSWGGDGGAAAGGGWGGTGGVGAAIIALGSASSLAAPAASDGAAR